MTLFSAEHHREAERRRHLGKELTEERRQLQEDRELRRRQMDELERAELKEAQEQVRE